MTAAEFILVADHYESRCDVHPGDSALTALLAQVRSEYLESPGLSLTSQQVCRLWQLDCDTAKWFGKKDRAIQSALANTR